MTDVQWARYPFVAQMPHARSWLQVQANLGMPSRKLIPLVN
jgi:hypothetical protein